MQRLMREGSADIDAEMEACARTIVAHDLASIIYTSGTTGTSKGVQLTHGNLASNIAHSLDGFDIGHGHVSVSFLPLSHVTARHADFALLYRGVTLAYCPFMEDLPQTLQEVSPTIFIAVPRVYENTYSQVVQKVKGFPKSAVYRWAVSVGRAHSPKILRGKTPTAPSWKLANKLVYSQVYARMGGRVEVLPGWRAPRKRAGRVVREYWDSHPRRLWSHRNFAGNSD